MRPLRVFTWHVHGNYLYYLSQANAEFYLPVKPGRDVRLDLNRGVATTGLIGLHPSTRRDIQARRRDSTTIDSVLD